MNGSFHFCRNQSATSLATCHICGVEESIKKFASYDLSCRTMTICTHCLRKIYNMDVVGKDTVREGVEGIAVIIKNTRYENCTLEKCEYCGTN